MEFFFWLEQTPCSTPWTFSILNPKSWRFWFRFSFFGMILRFHDFPGCRLDSYIIKFQPGHWHVDGTSNLRFDGFRVNLIPFDWSQIQMNELIWLMAIVDVLSIAGSILSPGCLRCVIYLCQLVSKQTHIIKHVSWMICCTVIYIVSIFIIEYCTHKNTYNSKIIMYIYTHWNQTPTHPKQLLKPKCFLPWWRLQTVQVSVAAVLTFAMGQ